jgi:hypothetical protein
MRRKSPSVIVSCLLLAVVSSGVATAQTIIYVPQAPSGINPRPATTPGSTTVASDINRFPSALDVPLQQSGSRYRGSQRSAQRLMNQAIAAHEKGDAHTACALALKAVRMMATVTSPTSEVTESYMRQADDMCREATKA